MSESVLSPKTDYVSKNLTLALDEDLLRAARKVALDRNTSVNQLVRDLLAQMVSETDRHKDARERLQEIFRAITAAMTSASQNDRRARAESSPAAARSGAKRIYTEDLQDGQIILGVEVVNPFRRQ